MRNTLSRIAAFLIGALAPAFDRLTSFMARQGLMLAAVQLPNGATIAMGTTYGPVKAVSAASNANPSILTLEASHGIIVTDVFEFTSGWSRANGNVYRAASVATNDVGAEKLNALSTILYPAGSGVGTIREVTGWTQISQILETNTSGGEQEFTEYEFLEDDARKRIPTVTSPIGFDFRIGDDATLPHYAALEAAAADRLQRAVRITLPSGSLIYFAAYVSMQKVPSMSKNAIMSLPVTMSLVGSVTRYAS